MNMDNGAIDGFKALLNGAFVYMDKDVDALVGETGEEVLMRAMEAHGEDMDLLARNISDFYEYSGSDSSEWDSWTDAISGAALELFDEVRRTALEMKGGEE